MLLGLGVKAFTCAVLECHVLQFALASRIADRAVERMIAKQKFYRGLACLCNFRRLCGEHLAFSYCRCASGLELRHLLLAHNAHAARRAQADPRVVAERSNFDACLAASLNQQRPCGSRQLLSINGEGYVSHSSPAPSLRNCAA